LNILDICAMVSRLSGMQATFLAAAFLAACMCTSAFVPSNSRVSVGMRQESACNNLGREEASLRPGLRPAAVQMCSRHNTAENGIRVDRRNFPLISSALLALLAPTQLAVALPAEFGELEADLRDLLAEDADWGAGMVRLAWHASGTYDRISKTGGSQKGTIHFTEELEQGANAGLEEVGRHSSLCNSPGMWNGAC
jgi:hypothetical protein